MAKKFTESELANALIACITTNNSQKLIPLLKGNIDPNSQNEEGNTALHMAVGLRNLEAIKILIEYGADRSITNGQGKLPLFLNNDNEEIKELLIPEYAIKKQDHSTKINKLISEHISKHNPNINKEILKNLAITYIDNDKVEPILNLDLKESKVENSLERIKALKFMNDALSYMILDLLEAKKHELILEDNKPKAKGVPKNPKPYDPSDSNLGSYNADNNDNQEMILDRAALSRVDNDNMWKHNYSAYQMLQAISACVFYFRETHPETLSKLLLTSVNWKALSLFARESQYNVHTKTNFGYREKINLIIEALHSILDNDELSEMQNRLAALIQKEEQILSLELDWQKEEGKIKDPTTPKENKKSISDQIKILKEKLREEKSKPIYIKSDETIEPYEPKLLVTIISYIKDEHSAHYINDAIKILPSDNSLENWPIMLNSLIEIGEALDNASPCLKNLFDPQIVKNTEIVRNFLCHAEIIDNAEQIKGLLLKGNESPILNVSHNNIVNLSELINYWRNNAKQILDNFIQEIYSDDLCVTLPAKIWAKVQKRTDQYSVNKDSIESQKRTKDKDEDVLVYLENKPFKTIHDVNNIHTFKQEKLKEWLNKEKLRIEQNITTQFTNFKFNDNLKTIFKNPDEFEKKISEYLEKNRPDYENNKAVSTPTETQSKFIKIYESKQIRLDLVKEYKSHLADLENLKKSKDQGLNKEKEGEINNIIPLMLKEYNYYAEKVQVAFNNINNNRKLFQIEDEKEESSEDASDGRYFDEETGEWEWEKSADIKNIEEKLKLDHAELQFYQIIVGSIARGLLELKDELNDKDFGKMFPEEFCNILRDTIIASRSYLAHIGMRQEGKSTEEAIDRPQIFSENSKQIIGSIQSVNKLIQANVSIDKEWYDFLSIKDSLIKGGIAKENILDSVETIDQLSTALDKINGSDHTYIIPLNVNGMDGTFSATNHWVGLYIVTNHKAEIISIKYIDPMGRTISNELSNAITNKTGISPEDLTIGKGIQFAYDSKSGLELKGNTYDCGPLLVQLFLEVTHAGAIQTKPQSYLESVLLGQKCRTKQRFDVSDENVVAPITINSSDQNDVLDEQPPTKPDDAQIFGNDSHDTA